MWHNRYNYYMESETLLKALTTAGIGPRRKLADAIRQQRVAVNGEIIEDFSHPVNREADLITIDGKPVVFAPVKTVCLMLNKPGGVLSTTSDRRGNRTVIDLIPDRYRHRRLYPIGRLDRDSTGLLLLTNDGALTYHLTHPRYEHEKEYLVEIPGSLSPADRYRLEQGIQLEDGGTHPARVSEVKSTPPYNYSITIHEGRKRQVRRMFAALGHRVLSLKRVRIGALTLGNLKEGQVRELSPHEIGRLMSKPRK